MSNTNVCDVPKSHLEDDATPPMYGVTQFWDKYWKVADAYDKEYLQKNFHSIEGIMLFAGLFSAVSAAYLVAMEADLKPDPTDTTNALLMMLVHSANITAFSGQDLEIPVWNGPSFAIVCSQILGYTALSASLLAALGAVLAKSWLNDFSRQRSEPLQDRGRRRQQKLDGLKTWRFDVFMAALSALIQLALFLFGTALSIRLWEMNRQVGLTLITTTAFGASVYLFITLSSLFSPSSPFHTPISSTVRAAIGLGIKLIEETTEYWAWRADMGHQKTPSICWLSWISVYVTGAIAFLFLAILSTVLLAIVTILVLLVAFITWVSKRDLRLYTRLQTYRPGPRFDTLHRFRELVCSMRNSAQTFRKFIHSVYLDPAPDPTTSDAHSVAWLLQTSSHPENFMAAAELVPDVDRLPLPDDLRQALVIEKVSMAFLHSAKSVSETRSSRNQLLQLSKTLVFVFCRVSQNLNPRFCKAALQQVTKVSDKLEYKNDPDLIFMLLIVTEVLSYKSGPMDHTKFRLHRVSPSQMLVAWLIPLLGNLLQLDGPRQSRFLPGAYRVFLLFEWPEGSELAEAQGIQYFRTFEMCFNMAVGVQETDNSRVGKKSTQEPHEVQGDCLRRVLEKLKEVDLRFNDIYEPLSEPLIVLSKLASISQFQQDFKDNSINSWAFKAFKWALDKPASFDSDGRGFLWSLRFFIRGQGKKQRFAKSLMQLAAAVDAFHPIESQVASSPISGDGDGQTLDPSPPRMDSKSLLSYLVDIERGDFTSETTKYALKIILKNESELPELAFNPSFVRYMLSAMQPSRDTGQWRMRNVPDVILQVLFAACHCLLDVLNKDTLLTLHSNLPDVALFLTCGVLNEGRPTLLEKVLQKDDQDFNAALLGILQPVFGDPFSQYLSWKAKDADAHTTPEHALRGVELILVLSRGEDRKKHFDEQVDGCIAREDSRKLRLPIMVGWLLREDGLLSGFKDITQTLFPPSFEEILYQVWDNLDSNKLKVEQELPLLMNCTTKWLSTQVDSGTGLSPATLAKLISIRDQLQERKSDLPSAVATVLNALDRAVQQHVKK